MGQPIACHCSQCARTSGNYAVMSSCGTSELTLLSDQTLAWFQSSPQVERGFCTRCGGNLFWKATPGNEIYIAVGTLDQPTGLRLASHIFVKSKSDYYEICDSLPQAEEW